VSQVVAAPIVLLSLLGFTAIYTILLVIAFKLMVKACREGLIVEAVKQKPAAAAKGGLV
jgi:cytochrome bd-type quinol oxidase subunit 1